MDGNVDHDPNDPIDAGLDDWPARVLIVATNGLEVDSLVPAGPTKNIHWCQSWSSTLCHCGVAHRPCDQADLTVVVGHRDRQLHHDPQSLVVHVLPRPDRTRGSKITQVVANRGADFAPWARNVVLNLVGPFSGPGLLFPSLTELRHFLALSQTWSCVVSSGNVGELVSNIATDPAFESQAEAFHFSVSLPDDDDSDDDLQALFKGLEDHLRRDASLLISCSWGVTRKPTIATLLLAT